MVNFWLDRKKKIGEYQPLHSGTIKKLPPELNKVAEKWLKRINVAIDKYKRLYD